MAFTGLDFIINGVKSVDIGVNGCYLVKTDASQISYHLMGSKLIIEEKVNKRNNPYFYGVETQPIEFDLKFSLLEDKMTPEILYDLAMIFAKDKYVPFESEDYIGRIFYIICTDLKVVTFGNYQGWIEARLRTSSSNSFSNIEISTFDLSTLTVPTEIIMTNRSNVMNLKYGEYIYEPQITIDLLDDNTSFTLTNQSNGGEVFSFTGLVANESLTVYNQDRRIVSSTGSPRISKLTNKNWFKLVYGDNRILVDKKMIIQVRSQFPLYM